MDKNKILEIETNDKDEILYRMIPSFTDLSKLKRKELIGKLTEIIGRIQGTL